MASSHTVHGMAPAPPGQVANFVNPPTKMGSNIALHTVMLFFVTLCVGVRLYTRRFITHQLGLDDYLCILAYALIITYSGLLLACGKYSLGYHLWDITLPNYIYGNKLEVVGESVYLVISATIKLSCLLFYRRVFAPSQVMGAFIYGSAFVISAGYTALLTADNLYCIPVRKHWDPAVPGNCLPAGSLAYSSGAFNVASDIFVVCLPLPIIWNLNMRLSRKLKVMALFGLGIVVVAMSTVRLAKTPALFESADYTWGLSTLAVYSILELYIGMICACLLAFPAFIDRYGPVFMSRLRSYSNLRRSGGTSAPSEEQRPSRNSKILKYDNDEYMNLAGGTSTTEMRDNPPSRASAPHHQYSQEANFDQDEALRSFQSPHTVSSAHIV